MSVTPLTPANAVLIAPDSSAAVVNPDRSPVIGLPSLRVRVSVSESAA